MKEKKTKPQKFVVSNTYDPAKFNLEKYFLFGASSKKEDDGKIGIYGTGLKYAIAVFLRNDIDFVMYEGKKKVTFTTVPVEDETYRRIKINGKLTSYTTRMGVNWELWQGFREIIANAIDEENTKVQVLDSKSVQLEDNTLSFVFNMADPYVEHYVKKELNQNFSWDRTPIYKETMNRAIIINGTGKNMVICAVYEKPQISPMIIYKEGIMVFKSKKDSIYDYEFYDVKINEERILDSSVNIYTRIWETVLKISKIDDISHFIKSLENSVAEAEISESDVMFLQIPEKFQKVMVDINVVPNSIYERLDNKANFIRMPDAIGYGITRGYYSSSNTTYSSYVGQFKEAAIINLGTVLRYEEEVSVEVYEKFREVHHFLCAMFPKYREVPFSFIESKDIRNTYVVVKHGKKYIGVNHQHLLQKEVSKLKTDALYAYICYIEGIEQSAYIPEKLMDFIIKTKNEKL